MVFDSKRVIYISYRQYSFAPQLRYYDVTTNERDDRHSVNIGKITTTAGGLNYLAYQYSEELVWQKLIETTFDCNETTSAECNINYCYCWV